MILHDEFRKYAVKHRGINSMVLHDYQASMTPYIIESNMLWLAVSD